MRKINITVIGAGAIGGVIGAYISRAGIKITLVDQNGDHVKAMQTHGLRIEAIDEDFTVPVTAISMKDFIEKKEKLDIVLLAVKAQHTAQAINQIKPKLKNDSVIVSLQNGLCEEIIGNLIGKHRTIGSFVNIFSDYIEPGYIKYGGVGSLYIGELDGSYSERLKYLERVFKHWGEVKTTSNILGYLWGKMSYASILIASALTDEKIVDVLKPFNNREVLVELSSEALAVAATQNILPRGFDDWEPSLLYPKNQRDWNKINCQIDKHIERLLTYKKVKTGFWRDLKIHKRKTEVPFYLKPIIDLGQRNNVKTPLTEELLTMITEIENDNRVMSLENLDGLKNVLSH